MAVVVFRHDPDDSSGRLAGILDARGIKWSCVDLWLGGDAEAAMQYANGLISLGGPMSVNDPLPWLRQEERYLRQAIDRGLPVFGICLGAQLLAKTLGATVYPMARKEVGWFALRLTPEGLRDPVLSALREEETVFQWHRETFELPPGAKLLAESERCPRQAFRIGSKLYGVQFHPEVTPETIADWCKSDAQCGDLREAAGPIDPNAHEERAGQVAAGLFGRWCDLLK